LCNQHAEELDPVRGVIQWPGLLNRPELDDSRARLDDLFADAADDPHDSGLGTQNFRDIQEAVAEMSDKLRSESRQFGTDEYILAEKFLKNLGYAARSPGLGALAKK
jgi:hypothetical protein